MNKPISLTEAYRLAVIESRKCFFNDYRVQNRFIEKKLKQLKESGEGK